MRVPTRAGDTAAQQHTIDFCGMFLGREGALNGGRATFSLGNFLASYAGDSTSEQDWRILQCLCGLQRASRLPCPILLTAAIWCKQAQSVSVLWVFL
jgi:hypothetical protein